MAVSATPSDVRMLTKARLRRWRERRRSEGLVTVTVTVSRAMAADIKAIEQDSRANPRLYMGPMVDGVSGRYVSIRRGT